MRACPATTSAPTSRGNNSFAGRIVAATVSCSAGRWHASITVDTPDPLQPRAENQGAVGVDLGVSALATLSTGEVWTGPKALRTLLGRLRRLSRALSRKAKGSRNRSKAKGRLANGRLARAVADMGFYALRRQLDYKAAWRGGQVVVADRWYPSSKTCSCCGHTLATLALAVRQWSCPGCGMLHDRDVNAATNLMNLAVSSTASACGGEGAGPVREHRVKPAPAKQESGSEVIYG
jgi:putative transposase